MLRNCSPPQLKSSRTKHSILKLIGYIRLMRFHKPAGILLLLAPTLWALWIANQGHPALRLVYYCTMGTILMRAAGCVVNDIADRHIDKHVKRTALRPLTTGEVSLQEALAILIGLLLAAFWIVMQLPIACFYYALAALGVTVLYPFCKRFLQAPQLVLGVAFSMGIPMAYAASQVPFSADALLLCLLNFAWIVSYDTIYAMVDKDDDLRIGVKSTAIVFADYDRWIVLGLQILCQAIWLLLAVRLPHLHAFYSMWVVGCVLLAYQQTLLSHRSPQSTLAAFSNNAWYGMMMWLALCI